MADFESPDGDTSLGAKRRWFRFSVRTLLLVMTLCACGIFGKLQYDRYRLIRAARNWLAPLVNGDGIIATTSSRLGQLPSCPGGFSKEEQIAILEMAIRDFSPKERLAALKLLVELYPDASRPILLRSLRTECDPGTRAAELHLISLFRKAEDVDQILDFLDHEDSQVRAAACDALGVIHKPSYPIPLADSWMSPGCYLVSDPPIGLVPLIRMIEDSSQQTSSRGARVALNPTSLPGGVVVMPFGVRETLERLMLSAATSAEREAAARALLEWPPAEYRLRVAEWGVWINGADGNLLPFVLDEIPSFVHQTGNPARSFKDRVNPILIITKPIIHITADEPLAVDIGAKIAWGRPWFAYPLPDDFCVDVSTLYLDYLERAERRSGKLDFAPWLEEFDRPDLAGVPLVGEGFPWLAPLHRNSGDISGGMGAYNEIIAIGVRWRSLIVSPRRQGWMSPRRVGDEPRFAWWSRLREVPSSWVASRGESERFLYYDGPTLAKSPITATWSEPILALEITDAIFPKALGDPAPRGPYIDTGGLPVGMFLRVDESGVAAYRIDGPARKLALNLSELTPSRDKDAGKELEAMLIEHSLTAAEAAGLHDRWKEQFFQRPGNRLIAFLTADEYNAICPLHVRPTPTQLVRVGIVLTEFP
jgi:hypothetical protein